MDCMQQRRSTTPRNSGLSLFGFIFVIAIIAVIAILGLRVVPTVVEYAAIKKALMTAKSSGSSPAEVKASFDKQRDVAYIESVAGKDLEIERTSAGLDVSVAYEKRISLFGPVSLVIDYFATTANPAPK
jgi:Tfp pilus assembly major pilin PilA